MAPRTRKRTPEPEDWVRPTPRHAKAPPTRFRSARAPRINAARYRQSTLTQIVPEVSFLSRGPAAEESEDEEQAPRPVKRRRRRIGPSQKTLTQIGWINHIVVPSDDEEQEEEGGDGENEGEEGFESEVLPSDDDEYDEVVGGEQNEIDDAEDVFYGFSDDGESLQQDKLDGGNLYGANDSPQTPRRPRPREIPSSQTPPVTPLTPLSVLRKRARYNQRSPLKAPSTNGDQGLCKEQERAKMPPPKLPTPVQGRRVRVALDSNVVKLAPALLSERSHVSDSQDLSDEDGFEAASLSGVAIGQETQAMIHRIDAACGPNPSLQSTLLRNGATSEVGSRSPSPSQANRSFNFDEEDGADAAPSAAPAKSSPILGEEFQGKEVREEECHQEPDIEKKAGDDEEAEEDDDNYDEEDHGFPASSLLIPRAPPPTQATPTYTPKQASHASQPFALQHPSQVSTVAETTQATPPRRRPTPTQRERARSQKTRRTQRVVGDAECNENATLRGIGMCSQASTTDDPIQSQTPKAQQCRSQQFDRIPESPLGNPNASSHSKTSHASDRQSRSRKPPRRSSPSPCYSPTTSPLHAPSSSFPQPPPALLLTSSPTSPSGSTRNRRTNGSDGRRRLELSSDSSGGGGGRCNGSGVSGRSGLAFDGKVLSATQMLPESLMNYSLPLPPAGWDAASSWTAEEEGGEGDER